MSTKKEIEIIEELCKQHQLKIYHVFKRANVHVSTIQNWRRVNPIAFEVKNALHEAIEQMIKDKEA